MPLQTVCDSDLQAGGDRVVLVACASEKAVDPLPAKDLYVSPLFRKARAVAESLAPSWYILSAQHGLVEPHAVVSPYNLSLKEVGATQRQVWAERIAATLKANYRIGTEFVFLAGSSYRELLSLRLRDLGFVVQSPLVGLSIGKQLQWLERARHSKRLHDLSRFYRSLSELVSAPSQGRPLGSYSGADKLPTRGVYFFFEPDQFRRLCGTASRVVRVGTHAVSANASSTLWQRLRTHRGGNDLSGSHRSSVFRQHVGGALLDCGATALASWGKGQTADATVRATEADLERQVSEYLRALSLVWLNIPDNPGPSSDRAYIERNSIALLAGAAGPIDVASSQWLGNYCRHDSVRRSSLWNVDFVDDNYDPEFLDVFDKYVDATCSNSALPPGPIAPPDWHQRYLSRGHASQLPLL